MKVLSIKKLINKDVYDIINVADNNNYIANGIVVHNSAADWAKAENKALKKKLAEVRTKHLLFILCFPLKVNKIESNYLQSFVNYWCLAKNTKIKIKDKDGIHRSRPIYQLCWEKDYEVLTYNIETGKYEYKKCEKTIKTKSNAELFELELENGLKIECTEDHPFLTQRGYVRLKDLTEDDSIEVDSRKCKNCSVEFIPNKNTQLFCCKKCNDYFQGSKKEAKEYQKKYRINNKEALKDNKREYYLKNRESFLSKASEHRIKNNEYINNWAKEYRKNNVELLRFRDKQYRTLRHDHYIKLRRRLYRKYMDTNPNFKLGMNLRHRLKSVLTAKNVPKRGSILKYVGCSIEFLKKYLEDKFEPGMSWDKYTHSGFHIDHIIPCASFDLTKEEEVHKCFHYTNLQPLWAKDNLSKGAKLCWSKSNR